MDGLSFENRYEKARIELNGHERFAAQEEEYFQLLQPYKYHTAIPHQNRSSLYKASLNLNEGSFVPQLANTAASPGDGEMFVMHIHTPAEGIPGEGMIEPTALNVENLERAGGAAELEQSDRHIVFAFATAFLKHDVQINDMIDLELSGTKALVTHATVRVTNIFEDAVYHNTYLMFDQQLIDTLDAGTNIQDGGGTLFKIENMVIRATSDALTSSMNDRINVYSFALKPEEHQPSGTCNFSRIDNAKLIFDAMNYDNSVAVHGDLSGQAGSSSGFNIYAHNYNVLRIMSGMG